MVKWDDMVLVGRIGKPHGLRGQVTVLPETDFAEIRFAPGAVLWTRPGPSGEPGQPLTVAAMRMQNGRAIVGFDGFAHIDEVEPLHGLELRVPETELLPLAEGAYYLHQLGGCVVETVAGERVGVVRTVEGGIGSSRLVVDGDHGEVLIPLADEICVEVDVEGRRVRIAPPAGLLDLNEVTPRASAEAVRRPPRWAKKKLTEPAG